MSGMSAKVTGSLTAADLHNPTLDGDFVALLQIQKEKKTKSDAVKEKVIDAIHALQNAAPGNRKTSDPDSKPAEHFALAKQLFDAADSDDAEDCRIACRTIIKQGLNFRNVEKSRPNTNATALHVALEKGSFKVANELIEQASPGYLMEECKVIIQNVPAEKTALHILAEKGQEDLARKLLDRISPGDTKDKFLSKVVLMEMQGQRPRHLSAIHIAALHGHTAMVDLLVGIGIDVNTKTNKKDTPVLWAARGNHINTVRRLIQLGADLRHQNDKGSTPLYWAVRYGFDELVEVLVKEDKAIVHQERQLGFINPLVLASALGFENIVKILLESGANVNLQITGGETALHHAAAQGNMNVVVVLLDHKAKLDMQNDLGDTALTLAASAGHCKVVRFLSDKGASLQNKNKEGKTVWHYAMDSKDTAMLITVAECYCMVRGKLIIHPKERSPLHIAAQNGDCSKFKCLIELGADTSAVDESGNTYLHIAARDNKVKIIEEFQSLVDLNKQNTDGDTALHLSLRNGHLESTNLLLTKAKIDIKNKLEETPLHISCKSIEASSEIVRHLVETIIKTHNWSVIDAVDGHGNTALHLAARTGKVDIIEALEPLNPTITNKDGDNPFHVGIKQGYPEVLEIMLEKFLKPGKNFDINQQNQFGETLLHLAVKQGDAERAAMLIYSGSKLDMIDKKGRTCLHLIVELSVSDSENVKMYLNVFDSIVTCATWWWCVTHDYHFPDEESDIYELYKRQAIFHLISTTTDKEGNTVLSSASINGAKEVFGKIFQISQVFRLEDKDKDYHNLKTIADVYYYDVTNLILPQTLPPETRKTGTSQLMNNNKVGTLDLPDGTTNAQDKVQGRSCLELVTMVPDIKRANEMLDVIPLCYIVKNCWSAYQWYYALLMIHHIIYMGFFSGYTIPLLASAHNATVEIYPFPTALFLIWPFYFLLLESYYLLLFCYSAKHNEKIFTKPIKEYLSPTGLVSLVQDGLTHITALMFSVFVVTWYIMYCFRHYDQGYVLALALITGWLFTITFTRGFETIHSFSIMLKKIIFIDVLRFLFIYSFILMAFSFALHALFQLAPTVASKFPNPLYTFFLVFNIMIGMGDLFDEEFDASYHSVNHSSAFPKVVYIFYILLSTIVLLNLLIAMMNTSYSEVKRIEESTWRVRSVRLALQMDKMLRRMRYHSPFRVLFHGLYFDSDKQRWRLKHVCVEKPNTVRNNATFNLDHAVSKLSTSMENISQKLENMSMRLDDIELYIAEKDEPSRTSRTKTVGKLTRRITLAKMNAL